MISVSDATEVRWPDVVTVMGTRGDPARCWCQWFRLTGAQWEQADRDTLRESLQRQVGRPVPPGVLAYRDEEPVGWCGIAPRAEYPRLERSKASSVVPPEPGVWSVTCFVVRVGSRRAGVSGELLAGAVDLARRHDARIVEGYPVDPSSGAGISAASMYHGTLSVFLRAGFSEVARPLPGRAVVRLALP